MILNDEIDHEKIANMTLPELKDLCRELRRCILKTVNSTGGHLASNLGTVELTAALHYVFDVKTDRIVWDVGHQAYAHKLLTGRWSQFHTLRTFGGISGFTRREESPADAFISGHSSTSISAAFGIASAMRLQGKRGSVAAVIGDGALTGGMAYEGLNNAGKSMAPLVVILNDNAMSISKSTGALARYLAHIRSTRKYYCAKEHVRSVLNAVPLVGSKLESAVRTAKGLIKDAIYDSSNMFENFGFQYIGPVNGHDLEDLIEALSVAKIMRRPCVVHVFTTKGKGWRPAEDNPGEYHAVTASGTAVGESFTDVFGRELERLAKTDSRICGITAAMKYATGMNYFKSSCGERFFDVGIAEQHAVTFAAGLAAEGMLPVFAVYSTFLQRGFDQLVHDCAIEKTHVTLAIDRAGFTGEDGETHQGIFDAAMLASIPNTTVYSPACADELRLCLGKAIYDTDGIAAVRYPKGSCPSVSVQPDTLMEYSGKHGNTLAVSYGRLSAEMTAAARDASLRGAPVDWLRLVRITPLPQQAVEAALKYDRVVFFEEGIKQGGIGERFGTMLLEYGFTGHYEVAAADGRFVPAGTVAQQLELFGLDRTSMAERLRG